MNFLAPMGWEYASLRHCVGNDRCGRFFLPVFFFFYWGQRGSSGKLRGKASKGRISGGIKRLLSICLPVTASSCLRSGLSMTENILIPPGLKKTARPMRFLSRLRHDHQYGDAGDYLPSAFLSSFSILLIPELSEANAANHKRISTISPGGFFKSPFCFPFLSVVFVFLC